MRYIFFTLLIVNVAYFVYAQFGDGAPPPAPRKTPANVDTLRLLHEHDTRGTNEVLSRVISNPVRTGDSSAAECLAAGPFEDAFGGQAVVRQLKALDIASELRALDRPTGRHDYRLLIPPASSLQEAYRKLRELKSRNIESNVITQGEYALGISLGVFADEETASATRSEREKEGYDVRMVEIPRLSREFWVFSTTSRNLELAPELWATLTSQHPGLEKKAMPCTTAQAGPAAPLGTSG